jgi:hypothetical protein
VKDCVKKELIVKTLALVVNKLVISTSTQVKVFLI